MIQFGFVATPSASVKLFTFTGNDLTGPVTVAATGSFTVSKDNVAFAPSVSYTQLEANNISKTVYVRFMPPVNGQDFIGSATVSTTGVADTLISLKGTSIDPINTLEVVNWNVEWFGSTTLGPSNDAQQEANVTTIVNNIGADLYGLLEVVSEARLINVVSQMPGYSYVISNFGSHTNTSANPVGNLAEAQKLAFIYKTSLFSNISVAPLLSQGINSAADITNPAYNYFASGRFPFMMKADVTLNGVTKTVRFVLIHAKANTSPTAVSYARRKAGSDTLHFTLNALYPNDNIVLLGDFNDDLDQSITAGFTTTSYSAFTTDNTHFFSPTLALSLAGLRSTVSYNDVIDHVELSNEMQCNYMPATANILSDVTSLVANYGTTTTDHYPVFTRYAFTTGPAATINYPGATYCQNAGTANVTFAGSAGGTYSSTPGLSINSTSGNINLLTSTPGTYTITYTIAATSCNPVYTTTATINITPAPIATISYNGSPYCQGAGIATVNIIGNTSGIFASTTGLTINTITGVITLGTSAPGTYTVTYTIAAGGGCAAVSTTASVTVSTTFFATISYPGTPYCPGTGTVPVTRTGSPGGIYSSTAGLTINPSTGTISLGTSSPETYIINYLIPATVGCGAFTATTTITINTLSIAPTGASASPTSLCGAGTVNLSVIAPTGSLGTGSSFKWYTGSCGGTLIGTGPSLSNVALAGTTIYYVRAEGSCNTTTCASITVMVNVASTVSISASPYTSLLPGLTTTLTATVTPPTSGNSLIWYRNGIVVQGATNETLNVSVDGLGSYYARTTTIDNCTATSNTIILHDSISDKLFITPNPNNGLFKVRYSSVYGPTVRRILTIYDNKGARVYLNTFSVISPYNSMDVDIRKEGRGLYFIIVSDANGNKLTEGKVNIL